MVPETFSDTPDRENSSPPNEINETITSDFEIFSDAPDRTNSSPPNELNETMATDPLIDISDAHVGDSDTPMFNGLSSDAHKDTDSIDQVHNPNVVDIDLTLEGFESHINNATAQGPRPSSASDSQTRDKLSPNIGESDLHTDIAAASNSGHDLAADIQIQDHSFHPRHPS